MSTTKTEQNEVHVPTDNDGEHLSALITTSFLQRLLIPLENWPQVISIQTGVVATWSLGENHPTLWSEW